MEAPCLLVVVSRHDLDWDTSDELLQETEALFHLLGDQLLHGAWFLSPRFTVSSQAVSAEFFRAARHARSRWLREVRGSISLRRESRSVVALARQNALADLDLTGAEGPPANPPPTALTPVQRLDVLKAGHIAKQMTFSGLMIIDGDHVPPRTWNELADRWLGPEPPTRSRVHRRRSAQSTPAAPGTPGHLKPNDDLREPGHEGV